MFVLEDVSKSFGELNVFTHLNLSVRKDRGTALIGASGCGKSTILRLMLGIISPNSGRILFDGTPLVPGNLLAIRRRLGYVAQGGGLFPHFTIRQNISLLARLSHWSKSAMEDRLESLIDLVKLPRVCLEVFPGQLSGGQRQRASLMRSLMLDPDVLLLDEPLAALDPLGRFELQTDLKEIFAHLKKTVLIVTHEMGEAAFLGDEIILLNRGRIEQQGTIGQLYQNPASEFVSKFISAQRSPLDSLREAK